MHPFEKPMADGPPGVSPRLDVRLKPRWRYDDGRQVLFSEQGKSVSLRGVLPAGTKVVPTVPSLADADPENLSEDEYLLYRSLQVVLPSAANTSEVADRLCELDGLELVSIPPRIELP